MKGVYKASLNAVTLNKCMKARYSHITCSLILHVNVYVIVKKPN